MLGRVFGALEACLIATMALGSLVMPLLLHLVGLRAGLAVVAVLVAAVALLGLPRMRDMDRRLGVPEGVGLLRALPLFAPLGPPPSRAWPAPWSRCGCRRARRFVREGEASDRFFVIESGPGRGHPGRAGAARGGSGEFFGEIGLVRDVPRTATVTALVDTVLRALPREDFLEAVTGQGESRSAVEDVVSRRLLV